MSLDIHALKKDGSEKYICHFGESLHEAIFLSGRINKKDIKHHLAKISDYYKDVSFTKESAEVFLKELDACKENISEYKEKIDFIINEIKKSYHNGIRFYAD